MSEIAVYMLPVGQGAMNLITEYDGSDLVNLVLIDCGELRSGSNQPNNKQASDISKQFVRDKMKERFEVSGRDICLDFLLITHRDQDHISFAKEIFDFDDMAMIVDDNKFFMRYHESWHDDVYTVAQRSQEMKCERTVHIDGAKYTIHTSINNGFVIDYNDKESKFKANCSCNPSYYFYIHYEYESDEIEMERDIYAKIVEDNKLYTWVDYSFEGKMDVYESCNYVTMLDIFFNLFETYCQDLSCKKELENNFNLLKPQAYKSYDKVLEDLGTGKTNLKQPILKCFIGGIGDQAQETINFIYSLTRDYKNDFSPDEDIFNFHDWNIGLRIIHYAEINKMLEFYPSIDAPNNATSAVSLLYDCDDKETFKVLFTGDATHQTFGMINSKKDAVDMLTGAIWTAPHHGSISSLCTVGETAPIDELLNETQIRAVVISAGYCNQFGHPHGSFIKKFISTLRKSENKMEASHHTICYNSNDTNRGNWICQGTYCPIFTTLTHYSYVAHIFKYSANSQTFYYEFEEYSNVTEPYKFIGESNTTSPSNDATVAVNEKAKMAGADISLKKLFIIR